MQQPKLIRESDMNFNEEMFSVPASAFPVPAILDTDTYNEIDDQFALIYALLSPKRIELRGVTAAPFLNSRSTSAGDGMEKSYQEIVRIIGLMGFEGRVPAFRGAASFLPDRATPVRSAAVDFIVAEAKRARSRGEKLFVISIGAITNLASALLTAPEIADDIVSVWLGGNDHVFENNREFNLSEDIPAARTVIESAAAHVRVPCSSVASALTTTAGDLKRELADCGKPGEYLFSIFCDFVKGKEKVIWDISAVSYLSRPEATEWEVIPREKLEDDGSWSFPETDRRMLIARKIDRNAVFSDLFTRLRIHVRN